MEAAVFQPFTIELVGYQETGIFWVAWLIIFVVLFLCRSAFKMLFMLVYLFVRERLVNRNRNLYLYCYDRNDVPEGGYKTPIGMTPIRKVGYQPNMTALSIFINPLKSFLEILGREVGFIFGNMICENYLWRNLAEHRKLMPKAHLKITRHLFNRGITITIWHRRGEKEKWETERVALMVGESRQLLFDEKFLWKLMIK